MGVRFFIFQLHVPLPQAHRRRLKVLTYHVLAVVLAGRSKVTEIG